MSILNSCVSILTFWSIALLTFNHPLCMAHESAQPKDPTPLISNPDINNRPKSKDFPFFAMFDPKNLKKLKALMDLKPTLPTYNIDINKTSASGPSAGGYMATQFHIAHSNHVVGSATFSSGPYRCSRGSIYHSLNECTLDGTPKSQDSVQAIKKAYRRGFIDNPQNLKDDKVFIFTGSKDTVVQTSVPDALYEQHKEFIPEQNIKYVRDEIPAGHGIVSKYYGSECGIQNSEFINKCDYDAPGELLNHIYGPLNPPTEAKGQLIPFSQMAFIQGDKTALAPLGFVYVPTACQKREKCKTHIVFHGCMQTYIHISDSFYGKLGYNEWAESNNIIVLYPQLQTSKLYPLNPLACWDWWGYSSVNFHAKKAPQMKSIFSMLQKLAGIVPADKSTEE